jgi:hypothetical protein
VKVKLEAFYRLLKDLFIIENVNMLRCLIEGFRLNDLKYLLYFLNHLVFLFFNLFLQIKYCLIDYLIYISRYIILGRIFYEYIIILK